MTTIHEYINNEQKTLIDAAADPVIRRFIDESDLETLTIDLGDGTQSQVEALSIGSIKEIIRKIMDEATNSGVELKYYICSDLEFNLCAKLDLPVGELMVNLDAFLRSKKVEGGLILAGLILLCMEPTAVAPMLTILSSLGFVNNAFIELCECNF